jgi:hypothetical protein
MANLEINSQYVYVKLSTTSVADALDTTGKTIVCEETNSLASSANVGERKTRCGTITNVDTPTVTISGSGVAAGDLDSTSISAQQLMAWQHGNTLLYFAYLNVVSGTLTQGEIAYMTGTCRVSNVTITSDINDTVVTFDYELAVTGTVDYTP